MLDLRVVAESAFFAVPEAKRGRGAHFASVALPTMVPPGVAMEWLYTGRCIPAAEAERWGLVNRIAADGAVLESTFELVDDIVASAPLSLQRLKLTFRRTQGMSPRDAIRLDIGPDVYASGGPEEGARAFLESATRSGRGADGLTAVGGARQDGCMPLPVQPFEIHVDQQVLDDLQARLRRTRWP